MQADTTAATAAFISSLDIREPSSMRGLNLSVVNEPEDLDSHRPKARVAGSSVVSFAEGTPGEIREAVGNWTLLAQARADKVIPHKRDLDQWFAAYNETLVASGWSRSEMTESEDVEDLQGFTVHQKILEVVAVALAPVPTALVIVTAALKALQKMEEDSPWITLFDHRSRSASSAGFSLSECALDDGVVSMRCIDFLVNAKQTMTQVLFFKFTGGDARMVRRVSEYRMTRKTLEFLAPKVTEKVQAFAAQNIADFDID